ncbi:MAG: hypothetical protein AAGA83_03320 [Cyanobacteria bacterium P01_F01_bin.116]
MVSFYGPHGRGTQYRRFVSFGALACLMLVGCTPQAECDLLNGALAEGNLRIQEINEGNLGGSGYNQGVERQVGRIYFDVSQVIDGLTISNRKLQAIQFELVEAYQQASDLRYRAAELIAREPNPNNQVKTDIRTLQLDSEANVGAITENLRKNCPLR